VSEARHWSVDAIGDLAGTTVLVTGSNSGIGYQAALQLARHGARVLLTSRDALRGDEALGQLRVTVPGADVGLEPLDLADLASVRALAHRLTGSLDRIDVLVNNAGVMATPHRTTADGFELQLGTNHLGHFALTGLLLPLLLAGSGPASARPAPDLGVPRVVTISSGAHRMGRIDRSDLMAERSYRAWRAYGRSKLANLLFMTELQRRADAAGLPLVSVAAHPGYAATHLQAVGPEMSGSRLAARVMDLGNRFLAQPAEQGAWPTLRAATDPAALGGDYFGPDGIGESRGRPVKVGMSAAARDADTAGWLWQRSVELTGVDYSALLTR
jgi:NAD(P)-dependent dehydrogenase (short-subunit alcohol dehydrogenase family)